MGNNLFLIGFMGSGKSSVGQLVAQGLEWDFLDTDEMIEQFTGSTIPRIFRGYGEDSFRQLETRMVGRIVRDCDRAVVATGGGTPVQARNRRLMGSAGIVVALRVHWERALERVRGTNRPLARDQNRFKQLWKQRQEVYDWAPVQVDTNERTREQVATELIDQFDSHGE